jgi:hypothetical protein
MPDLSLDSVYVVTIEPSAWPRVVGAFDEELRRYFPALTALGYPGSRTLTDALAIAWLLGPAVVCVRYELRSFSPRHVCASV